MLAFCFFLSQGIVDSTMGAKSKFPGLLKKVLVIVRWPRLKRIGVKL